MTIYKIFPRLIAAGILAFTLASCAKQVPAGSGEDGLVTFSTVVGSVEEITKGSLLSSVDKIKVTAWNNDESDHSRFISGYNEYVLTSGSVSTDIRWTRPYEKIFYAYANLPASGIATVTSDTYEGQTLSYTLPTDAAAQNDILMGVYAGNGTSTRTASLNLQHALTFVVFNVGTLTHVKKITGITIKGVYASGSVTQGSNGAFGTWTGTSATQDVSQTISAYLSTTAGAAIGVPFILIPQTAADGLEVEMELTLTDDTTMTCTGTLGSTTEGGIDWEAGKTNIYTISADVANNLTITSTVSEWGVGESTAIEPKEPAPIVLTLSFKSAPSGLDPQFLAGEKIKVSNGNRVEDCTITVSESTATITTTISEDGDLTAVYPASAAKMNGKAIEGVIIPETQGGAMSNATISIAKIAEGETAAQFELKAAVFVVTPPDGTTQFDVKSLKQIVSGHRTGSIADINTGGSDASSRQSITVGDGVSALASPCYVALCAGANLSDLAFDNGSEMKGLTPAEITENAIALGNAYTIAGTNWHPYVLIGGKKWATMNIGAISVTGKGSYFFWGGTTGYLSASGPGSGGFCWANTPFNNGSSSYNSSYFNSIKDDVCPNNIIALDYDAAAVNWGFCWRMPVMNDFSDLVSDVNFIKIQENSVKIVKAARKSDSSIYVYFPVAGLKGGIESHSDGSFGDYWTAEIKSNAFENGHYEDISYSNDSPTFKADAGGPMGRCYGLSIRAIAD